MREKRVPFTIDRRTTKQTLQPGESRPTEESVEINVSESFADINLLFNELVPYTSTIRAAMGRIKNGKNSEMALRELNRHLNAAYKLIQKIEHGLEVLQKNEGVWVRKKFPETRAKIEASIKDAEELLKILETPRGN